MLDVREVPFVTVTYYDRSGHVLHRDRGLSFVQVAVRLMAVPNYVPKSGGTKSFDEIAIGWIGGPRRRKRLRCHWRDRRSQ